jgi:hypothetical protein
MLQCYRHRTSELPFSHTYHPASTTGTLCLCGQLLGNAATRTDRIRHPRAQNLTTQSSPTASIPTTNRRLLFGPYVCATNTTADIRYPVTTSTPIIATRPNLHAPQWLLLHQRPWAALHTGACARTLPYDRDETHHSPCWGSRRDFRQTRP